MKRSILAISYIFLAASPALAPAILPEVYIQHIMQLVLYFLVITYGSEDTLTIL